MVYFSIATFVCRHMIASMQKKPVNSKLMKHPKRGLYQLATDEYFGFTPLKINTEHYDEGLEDHFPF